MCFAHASSRAVPINGLPQKVTPTSGNGLLTRIFDLVQKSRNLVDGYQTFIAMSNNELLMKLRRCKDAQEIQQCMERLLVLLSYNEAFLNHPEGTFPMLVLSGVR